jgi:hypothetical protein
MKLFRYRKYKVWAQCIIAVACLILFVLPLSHKFYLNADTPYGLARRHKYFHDHRFAHSAKPLMNYNKLSSFSPDKRYDLRPVFELAYPGFNVTGSCTRDKKDELFCCRFHTSSSFLFTAFRGPPLA